MSFDGPWDGKRYEIRGLYNRNQYVIIDEEGIMITFPDNLAKNWNYQATATALTRIITMAMHSGLDIEVIRKQLRESSMQEKDTPAVLLEAINKYTEDMIREDKKVPQSTGPEETAKGEGIQ